MKLPSKKILLFSLALSVSLLVNAYQYLSHRGFNYPPLEILSQLVNEKSMARVADEKFSVNVDWLLKGSEPGTKLCLQIGYTLKERLQKEGLSDFVVWELAGDEKWGIWKISNSWWDTEHIFISNDIAKLPRWSNPINGICATSGDLQLVK